jgi:conjugal transfer pilus assembly protein TraD
MRRRTLPPRRPYWLLPVFAALMLSPPAWATAALLSAAIGVTLARGIGRARRARARSDRSAAERGGSVLLGREPSGEPLRLSERQLSAHGLILGASGAGKTTTLVAILSDHIRRGRPVIAIDMKGSPEFTRVLAEAAAAAGRPIRVWSPDGPTHWNPLQHGNATELKDKLIATERFTEPHYKRAAERYVQTVLRVLEQAHPERPPTLAEVVSLMDPRRLPGILRRVPRPLANSVQDYLAGLTPDQLSAVHGLGTRLAIVSESHTGSYLSPGPDSIDLRKALAGEEVAVFSLNASRYAQLSAQLGALAIQDLIAAMGSRLDQTDRAQAIVGVDEFSGLGEDHLLHLLARGRESGVSVLVATQEMADLDRAGRGFKDQVIGVTALKIIHRQEVPASARLVAEMIGTEKVWERTYNIGGGLLAGRAGSRGTWRQLEQFMFHPNEIMSLRTGEAVAITKLPEARARHLQIAPAPEAQRPPAEAARREAPTRQTPPEPAPAREAPTRQTPPRPAPPRAAPPRSTGPAPPSTTPPAPRPGRTAPRLPGREGPDRG